MLAAILPEPSLQNCRGAEIQGNRMLMLSAALLHSAGFPLSRE
jgi:hypothetical protein